MEIKSAADLEPKSQGFANRATESINIIGGVVETLFNSIGGAIADITGQPHGSHLNINAVDLSDARFNGNPADRINVGVRDKINRGFPEQLNVPTTEDSRRIQKFIDHNDADFFV